MSAKIKKELQAVQKELKALSKKVDKLKIALEKENKPKPKATKKAATKKVKKGPVKKAATKKATPKKAAPKKKAKVTAADSVLKVIQSLKKGTNTEALMKKTGFDKKKIANIVFKLKKQGKITVPKKGLYMKA